MGEIIFASTKLLLSKGSGTGAWVGCWLGFESQQIKIVCCFSPLWYLSITVGFLVLSLSFLTFQSLVSIIRFLLLLLNSYVSCAWVNNWFISVSGCYSPLSPFWDLVISMKPVEMETNVFPNWKLQHLLFQIVVIFDGHAPSTNLSETLKYLVKNRTYLEWKSVDAEEQEAFWARLRETILAASSQHPLLTNDEESL